VTGAWDSQVKFKSSTYLLHGASIAWCQELLFWLYGSSEYCQGNHWSHAQVNECNPHATALALTDSIQGKKHCRPGAMCIPALWGQAGSCHPSLSKELGLLLYFCS
jgi:hypothetical protein